MFLSRREFLKLLGLISVNIFSLPFINRKGGASFQRSKAIDELPDELVQIFRLMPSTTIDQEGYLWLMDSTGSNLGRVTLAPTLWNNERNSIYDRLDSNEPWAIVLHWFGEGENYRDSIPQYLWGMDSFRRVDDYLTRTSAHFLVGDHIALTEATNNEGSIGIIQTQNPYVDGTPTLASHLKALDYTLHHQKKQYFVRALYQLSFENHNIHSILQDWFDGPKIDPNWRSIAVEITGADFDEPSSIPSHQKIANVSSVVWAIMKRYRITALNILGHNEIDLDKADPGKNFVNLIRFIIGIKALFENDPTMNELVFGQVSQPSEDIESASIRYFTYLRDYHVLIAKPVGVFDWEVMSKYWFVYDIVSSQTTDPDIAQEFLFPISRVEYSSPFDPAKHEGIDVFVDWGALADPSSPKEYVKLIANGSCVFVNQLTPGYLKSAIFRHRLSSGGEILSVYSNMDGMHDLQIGKSYRIGYPIGYIKNEGSFLQEFLRLAVCYSATWDVALKSRPYLLPNTGSEWIYDHYLDPMQLFVPEGLVPGESKKSPV